uniref:Cro r I n=1 Tax=Cronartium ribicola TaxID=27354 RepID=Q9P497_CRORI|nr:Cro r I [Cronartium ribicola]
MAYFSLCLFSTFDFANGFHFATDFKMPPNITGDLHGFLQNFYTAVDSAQGKVALTYFTDTPTPEVDIGNQKLLGKPAILAAFNRKTTDATYEKQLNSVILLAKIPTLLIQVNAIVTKTPIGGGGSSTQNYMAKLSFLTDAYVGKLSKMVVNLS